jgi:hypothetical protein
VEGLKRLDSLQLDDELLIANPIIRITKARKGENAKELKDHGSLGHYCTCRRDGAGPPPRPSPAGEGVPRARECQAQPCTTAGPGPRA